MREGGTGIRRWRGGTLGCQGLEGVRRALRTSANFLMENLTLAVKLNPPQCPRVSSKVCPGAPVASGPLDSGTGLSCIPFQNLFPAGPTTPRCGD